MKSLYSYFLIVLAAITLASCNKEKAFPDTANQVGISKVTYFPMIAIKGDLLNIIDKGSSFVDPGVDATVNGAAVTPAITGSVDASTPGIYYLTYTATNEDGFSASDYRIVIVKEATAASPDYSGYYRRNAGAFGISRWIQLTPTTYAVSNPGGASGYDNFWYVVTVTGGNVVSIASQKVPQQLGANPVEIKTLTTGTMTASGASYKYTWAIGTAGFGTGNRTFLPYP